MRFARDHDGEALAAAGVSPSQFEFHAQFPGQALQAGGQGRLVCRTARPGSLQRHAELAPRDLFFQSLDIGVLLKKEIGHARDDPGFIAPNDRQDRKFFHC